MKKQGPPPWGMNQVGIRVVVSVGWAFSVVFITALRGDDYLVR
jgi:hypothetical protein